MTWKTELSKAVGAMDAVTIPTHYTIGGGRFIDKEGRSWPRARCGVVLQRLHRKSETLIDTTCPDCLQAVAYRPYVRLPYNE